MRKLDRNISKRLQKSLTDVISRIKIRRPNLRIRSTTSRLINGCRPPHGLPLHVDGHRLRRRKSDRSDGSDSEAAESESAAIGGRTDKSEVTLEDVDRFLFENFRSLFSDELEFDREAGEEKSESPVNYDTSHGSFETPDLTPSELCGSRGYFTSPASSVTDEERTSLARSDDAGGFAASTITASSAAKSACLKPDLARVFFARGGVGKEKSRPTEDCIAVLRPSGNPVEEFRRSMGQVMEARARHGEVVDLGFMEELLFCYLRMNDKKYYRFVLDAFVDSVLDMRRSSCDGSSVGAATEDEVAGKETWMKKGKERKN